MVIVDICKFFHRMIEMVNYITVHVNATGDCEAWTSMHRVSDGHYTIEEVEKDIMIRLGGKVATEIVYGEPCLGNCSDLHASFELGQFLVEVENIYDFRGWVANNCPAAMETHANRDITMQTIVSRCYNKAKRIIVKNRKILDRLAEEVIDKRVVTYKDIDRIKGVEGISFK